jgi:hypothetical protein
MYMVEPEEYVAVLPFGIENDPSVYVAADCPGLVQPSEVLMNGTSPARNVNNRRHLIIQVSAVGLSEQNRNNGCSTQYYSPSSKTRRKKEKGTEGSARMAAHQMRAMEDQHTSLSGQESASPDRCQPCRLLPNFCVRHSKAGHSCGGSYS